MRNESGAGFLTSRRPQGPQHRAGPGAEREDVLQDLPRGALDGIAAADFFTVEVLILCGLVRNVVFFVMTLMTRTVAIAGITSEPEWYG